MLLACAAATLLTMSSGCRNVESVTIPNVFRPMPERPLADVPVPVGLRLKHRGSYVFNSNYRVAKLRYTGALRTEEIDGFYREQMLLSQWALVREDGEDTRTLEFKNDEETCTVTFNRRGGVSIVDIVVEPRSNGTSSPATHAGLATDRPAPRS